MRRSLWSLAVAVLAFSVLAMVGGTAIGGPFGQIAAAYGLLFGLCAVYMFAGLAIRDRVRRRLGQQDQQALPTDRLAGRRVF